jgi:hypothetical protein
LEEDRKFFGEATVTNMCQIRKNRNPSGIEGLRLCFGCGLTLPIDCFGKLSYQLDGINTFCKDCIKKREIGRQERDPGYKERARLKAIESGREYRDRNREKVLARARDLYTPLRRLVKHLKSKYGISLEYYEALLKLQDGRCGICSTTLGGLGARRRCLDHCHITKIVRGVLV